MFGYALTFVGSRESCSNMRPIVQHLAMDPANKTCVIDILEYFTLLQPKSH